MFLVLLRRFRVQGPDGLQFGVLGDVGVAHHVLDLAQHRQTQQHGLLARHVGLVHVAGQVLHPGVRQVRHIVVLQDLAHDVLVRAESLRDDHQGAAALLGDGHDGVQIFTDLA